MAQIFLQPLGKNAILLLDEKKLYKGSRSLLTDFPFSLGLRLKQGRYIIPTQPCLCHPFQPAHSQDLTASTYTLRGYYLPS
jgi:hypothetical protein